MADDDTTIELLTDGDRIAGLDLLALLIDDDEELTTIQRVEAVTQVGALAGSLWNAAIVLVEQIFEDIDAYEDDIPSTEQLEAALVLGTLPPQFADDYTLGFARQYLVAAVDLTSRLSGDWHPPACFAQELQLHQLLNLTEVMIEVNDADVPFDWRATLEAELFDGPSEFAPRIAPPVSTWFVPREGDRLPPYAEDDPA